MVETETEAYDGDGDAGRTGVGVTVGSADGEEFFFPRGRASWRRRRFRLRRRRMLGGSWILAAQAQKWPRVRSRGRYSVLIPYGAGKSKPNSVTSIGVSGGEAWRGDGFVRVDPNGWPGASRNKTRRADGEGVGRSPEPTLLGKSRTADPVVYDAIGASKSNDRPSQRLGQRAGRRPVEWPAAAHGAP